MPGAPPLAVTVEGNPFFSLRPFQSTPQHEMRGYRVINQASNSQELPAIAAPWCLDNQQTMRYAISVAAGLATTLLLFLLMQALIKSDMSPFTDSGKGQVVEFARLLEEVEVPPRDPPKPPPPPDEMPPDRPTPDYDTDVRQGIEIGPIKINREREGPIGPAFKTDGEYLPIVKVEPVYPRRAQQRGIEGYVLLEFVVTTSGAVRNPVVVEAKPPGIFDRSAINAALKFKYRPKIANGEPIEVSGVRNLIRFELEGG